MARFIWNAAFLVGAVGILMGCGSSPKATPVSAAAVAASSVYDTNPELWVTHDETEMSIPSGKEHSVHPAIEIAALRPTLVTQRKAHP
jgi:hypothetical protein